jgi:glycosyltransferase involved in cell wall biosynthesis
MRIAAYTDYVYHCEGDTVFAERAFALFLARVGAEVGELVVVGRLMPQRGRSHYPLPQEVDFVPLPYYPALSNPIAVIRSMTRSLLIFWEVLERVDAVWLLGPHPLAFPYAALARVRQRRVVLAVRQDFMSYVQSRHPRRRWIHVVAWLLEHGFRALGRASAVVVVGPGIANAYRRAPHLLQINVSLIREEQIAPRSVAAERSYDGELRLLSVGRIDTEKNPLLLADVLAELRARDPRWRLVVCGEGPMLPALAERLRELGVERHAELRGYVPVHDGLLDVYRNCHAFLHVSWTEGVPQVLFEAFASRLPVVATDVGGVSETVEDAALLIPPGSCEPAVSALQRIAADGDLRLRLTDAGAERVSRSTMDAECRRVAALLRGEGNG